MAAKQQRYFTDITVITAFHIKGNPILCCFIAAFTGTLSETEQLFLLFSPPVVFLLCQVIMSAVKFDYCCNLRETVFFFVCLFAFQVFSAVCLASSSSILKNAVHILGQFALILMWNMKEVCFYLSFFFFLFNIFFFLTGMFYGSVKHNHQLKHTL